MSRISRLYSEKPVSVEVNDSLNIMTDQISEAIRDAKGDGVPQGLIVAILSAFWHEQTARLVEIKGQMECKDY